MNANTQITTHLTLFGGFHLSHQSGNPLDLGSRKARALLVWLAANPGKEHAREKLAFLLWPDGDETHARHSLRQALADLRKVFPEKDGPLISSKEWISLDINQINIDVIEFDKLIENNNEADLDAAIALYKGEFVEGCNPRSEEFDQWLITYRNGYGERAAAAIEKRLSAKISNNEPEATIALATQLIAIDPLRETAYRALMHAHAELNNHATALRWYRQCNHILERELGITPTAETKALYEKIVSDRDSVSENKNTASQITIPRNSQSSSEHQLCIVVVEMTSYLQLMENLDPGTLESTFSRYTNALRVVIEQYNGRIEMQSPGTITVSFGKTKVEEKHIKSALKASFRLHAILDKMILPQSGLKTHACIGITSGSVKLGPMSVDKFRVLSGSTVSFATKLSKFSESGKTFISSDLFNDIVNDYRVKEIQLNKDDHHKNKILWQVDDLLEPENTDKKYLGLHRRVLHQFNAALAGVQNDIGGHSFLIRGEAKSGKTILATEFLRLCDLHDFFSFKTNFKKTGDDEDQGSITHLLGELLALLSGEADFSINQSVEKLVVIGYLDKRSGADLTSYFDITASSIQISSKDVQQASKALAKVAANVAKTGPMFILIENMHDADSQTLELLAGLITSVGNCPALLVMTSRFEGEPLDPVWRGAMRGAPLTIFDLESKP